MLALRHDLEVVRLVVHAVSVAVMDLRWVAALAVLVTAEKLLPNPRAWRIGIGAVMILAGAAIALYALIQT